MEQLIMIIGMGLIVFVGMLRMLIFADIILSWLSLAGLKWRPKFLADIIDPTYKFVRSIVPTRFGPLDFTPIIIIFFLIFIERLLYGVFPGLLTINLSVG